MRIYHLGAMFLVCLGLGIVVGYSLGRIEVFGMAGFILGIIPIVIYRRAIIKKEKNSSDEENKTSYT
ncbi:hypothetical protein [Oceanobacillus sp. J11TS1]|uniref:hypothetical protein n=1 Tax=Oceanobacillus sp. J11TS1 TaxID=2807191 RepID=UPI001B275B07|nr:hypothetical protein [Oceanobacillus sp. J11TS1]GIO23316.1 hypothetical protein J11TS1_18970 [Oceanobacillus sp. J11TS1]